MGWEKRRGKFYYYRKVWREGRAVSVYCGGGARGMQAAREDQQRRLAQQQARSAPAPTQPSSPQPPKTLTGWLELLRAQNASRQTQFDPLPSTTGRTGQK